jgi:hypothetical protein
VEGGQGRGLLGGHPLTWGARLHLGLALQAPGPCLLLLLLPPPPLLDWGWLCVHVPQTGVVAG